jgi:hypothetical protein
MEIFSTQNFWNLGNPRASKLNWDRISKEWWRQTSPLGEKWSPSKFATLEPQNGLVTNSHQRELYRKKLNRRSTSPTLSKRGLGVSSWQQRSR